MTINLFAVVWILAAFATGVVVGVIWCSRKTVRALTRCADLTAENRDKNVEIALLRAVACHADMTDETGSDQ